MQTIKIEKKENYAIVHLDRGRANPINQQMVTELRSAFESFQNDDTVAGVILTGKKHFFSAGLDVIELYGYNEVQMEDMWMTFLELIAELTAFGKPLISAITGHSPAGGCVFAICTDYRVMAEGKYKIGLNELPVGIIVPDTLFDLYAFWLGQRNAAQFILEGKLLTVEEAYAAQLVDKVVPLEEVLSAAEQQLKTYISLEQQAWRLTKRNIRRELVEKMKDNIELKIKVALRQWWSPNARQELKTIIDSLKK